MRGTDGGVIRGSHIGRCLHPSAAALYHKVAWSGRGGENVLRVIVRKEMERVPSSPSGVADGGLQAWLHAIERGDILSFEMGLPAHVERAEEPEAGRVLAKAVLRAAEELGLSRKELGDVLGVSAATVSRLGSGRPLVPQSKEGELALLLVRAWRSLDAVVGGRPAAVRAWFQAPNHHLGGVPAELCRRVEGLVDVVRYLDAMRGAQ